MTDFKPELRSRRLQTPLPSQDLLHGLEHLSWGRGLLDRVVYQVSQFVHLAGLDMGRVHDAADAGVVTSEDAEQIGAADATHLEVGDDHVVAASGEHRESGFAAHREID